jgi:hypothetical protein
MPRLFQGAAGLLHAMVGRSGMVNAKIHHEINAVVCYADFDAIMRTAKFIFLLT